MLGRGIDGTVRRVDPATGGGCAPLIEVVDMLARRVLLAVTIGLAVIWPAAIPAAAADPEPPGECAESMPLSEVEEGQTGIGWTVVRGTEPRPFAVEVLGVYPNGVLPGHDLILVRVSDTGGQQFVANARGIWGGMSGSPVYIDDKLVGAVAYGFSFGPSTLGGLTPFAELREVGDLEDAGPTQLSRPLRRALQQATPAAVDASGFGRIALPVILPKGPTRVARSGGPKRRAAMRARFDLAARLAQRGLVTVPLTGARTGPVQLAVERPVPGGNFGVSLAHGDLAAVGIGTVTWVCGERVLAFGHPMLLTGLTNLGAHVARSLDIVDDPTFGPYKLAVPGELVGRVGQDRVAAVAARLDRVPDLLTVSSLTRYPRRARSRDGTTWVSARTPRFLGWLLPAYHAFVQILSVADGFEDGSVGMGLRVAGRRADGRPFEVTFGDRWIGADRRGEEFWDTASAGAIGVGLMLGWLVENPFERVTRDETDLALDLGSPDRWIMQGVTVSRNGGPPRFGSPICVRAGDRLSVRVALASEPGGSVKERVVQLDVPRRFGALRVGGGRGFSPWFDPGFLGSFDQLLDVLSRTRSSDQLVVRINRQGITRASNVTKLKRVTVGNVRIALRPLGSPGCR
ncbi:hypothetical protein BH23CHL8_BH23CHL8_00630 [soil metagenome]